MIKGIHVFFFTVTHLYMYKEKGSSDVHMAYPSVYNWMSSLAIEDKKSIDVLVGAEKTMVDVVNETIE
jgi:hypothetical protein